MSSRPSDESVKYIPFWVLIMKRLNLQAIFRKCETPLFTSTCGRSSFSCPNGKVCESVERSERTQATWFYCLIILKTTVICHYTQMYTCLRCGSEGSHNFIQLKKINTCRSFKKSDLQSRFNYGKKRKNKWSRDLTFWFGFWGKSFHLFLSPNLGKYVTSVLSAHHSQALTRYKGSVWWKSQIEKNDCHSQPRSPDWQSGLVTDREPQTLHTFWVIIRQIWYI